MFEDPCCNHHENGHSDQAADETQPQRSFESEAMPVEAATQDQSEIAVGGEVEADNPPFVLDLQPEMFEVEGAPCEDKTPVKESLNKNKEAKRRRNSGLDYISTHSGKHIPSRVEKPMGPGCNPAKSRCRVRKLLCSHLTKEQRQRIKTAYYETGDLQAQREWLTKHVSVKGAERRTPDGRRNTTWMYFLPKPVEVDTGIDISSSNRAQVCKKTFLDTLGISERQVRSAITKESIEGVVQKEGRGGRPANLKMKDGRIREDIKAHINRFPRMESHYCRSTTSYQYLSSDLNVSTMHELYKAEHPDGGSESTYRNIFNTMNLKFHKPKKDQCGICAGYSEATEDEKERLRESYECHIAEKEKVRTIKKESKTASRANPELVTAVFDLQQVIYLPKSERSEIFYKRRLACYNFTVFDIATRDGFCYTSHEGTTKRGSNEIASSLYDFLTKKDQEGAKEVNLFCDGCPGQNKNSILPGMLHCFLRHSSSIHTVTVYFFETNHGQSEGDSMHSVIERKLRKMGDIFLPAQLAVLMQLARKSKSSSSPSKRNNPYKVKEISTEDVLDWKAYSIGIGFLRCRKSGDGKDINWKDFMAIKMTSDTPEKFYIKMSHLDDDFSEVTLSLSQGRRAQKPTEDMPDPAYRSQMVRPKLAEAKFEDLMKLAGGENPVIKHPDHVRFYRSLPH